MSERWPRGNRGPARTVGIEMDETSLLGHTNFCLSVVADNMVGTDAIYDTESTAVGTDWSGACGSKVRIVWTVKKLLGDHLFCLSSFLMTGMTGSICLSLCPCQFRIGIRITR